MKKLLTVEERFEVSHRGLVVIPLLKIPSWSFRPFKADITVVDSENGELKTTGEFNLEHLLYSATEGKGDYRVALSIPGLRKEDIKRGASIWVAVETYNRLVSDEKEKDAPKK